MFERLLDDQRTPDQGDPLEQRLPDDCQHLLRLAARAPRRALHQSSPDAAESSHDHATVGWILVRNERLARATEHLTIARDGYQAAGDVALAQWCQHGLLLARQLGGEGESLQAAWDELALHHMAAGEWVWAARARCEQIAHLNILGKPRAAKALVASSNTLVATHGTLADQARFVHVAGVAAISESLDVAETLLNQARRLFVYLRRSVDVAKVLFELAWIAQRREQFDIATANLERALAVFDRQDLPLRIALCHKDLGTVAARVGDYATAIAYAVQARAMFKQTGRRDMQARCDLNIGVVAHYSGMFDLAFAAYRRAEHTSNRFGNHHLQVIAMRNQALTLVMQQRPADALRLLDELAPKLDALGDQLEHAEALVVQAMALGQQHYTEHAIACLIEARDRFAAQNNAAGAAECQIDLAWFALERGDIAGAQAYLQRSLGPLHNRPFHLWRAYHALAQIAEQSDQPASALGHYLAAGALITGLRRRLASEHASSGVFAQASTLYHDAMRLSLQQHDLRTLLVLAEQQRAVLWQQRLQTRPPATPHAQARQRQRDMQPQLALLMQNKRSPQQNDLALHQYIATLLENRHSAFPPAEIPYKDIDIGAIQQRLSAQYGTMWSVLMPLVIDGNLHLIVLHSRGIEHSQVAYTNEIRDVIERAGMARYRPQVYSATPEQERNGTAWAALHTLADTLLPPFLRQRLGPEHRLLIVPSGSLHNLPWAALRLDNGWLCEQAVLQYCPTLADTLAPVHVPTQAPALLLACDTFNGALPDLPFAVQSMDVAQQAWHGPSQRLQGAEASGATLSALADSGHLAEYRLLHLASHAFAGSGSGLLGRLTLADGDMLVDDVTQLRLPPALVVLAACWGAASEVLPGDEVLGLGRALLQAGAAGVLASLWPIYDHSVLWLLRPFYAALASGQDAARALATAQRTMIMSQEAEVRSPWVWASFGVTGAAAASAG